MAERKQLVVVGTGMAGLEVASELRRRRPDGRWQITLLGEEPVPAYNRIQLSKLLAGGSKAAELELREKGWYRDNEVDVRAGCPARSFDLERRIVFDGRGGSHPYDSLVIATGSRPVMPPIAGVRQQHVFFFRTNRDVERIAARARRARNAVVVGGGLLGLEAAAGLLGRGLHVAVVEAADRLMPQQLDGAAAAVLEKSFERLGLQTAVGAGVASIYPDRVRLHDGSYLPAELVVIAVGIKPETTLARAAGIEVKRGILVDDALRTSARSVVAVGECVEHRGTVYGLWAPLAEQARVAAATLVGDPAGFHGAVTATTLKVVGVDVFAGGAQGASGTQDEVVWSDGRSGTYRKLVLDGDRLAGAILVGDVTGARELAALLQSGERCPAHLIDPTAAATPPAPADSDVVCSCNAVRRGAILSAIRVGRLTTLAQVASVTRASTGCGSCAGDVTALLAPS